MSAYLAPRPPGRPPALSVGVMNFGWRTQEDEARRIVDRSFAAGLTYFDTANVYSDGESERMLGRAFGGRPRDSYLVATKVGLGRVNGKAEGLSRAAIAAAIDQSLARLGLDYVDVYYLHAPDRSVPIEETLGAVGDLVQAGKVRHLGISNYASWEILRMFQLCDAANRPRPVISQVLYNAVVRQIEIEYLRFAAEYGLHSTVYNALAGGLLSGKHAGRSAKDAPPEGSRFFKNDMYRRRYWTEKLFDFAAALGEIAARHGMTPAALAYAWLASRPGVDSILLGPVTVEHLDAAITGCAAKLSPETLAEIDALQVAFEGTDATYAR